MSCFRYRSWILAAVGLVSLAIGLGISWAGPPKPRGNSASRNLPESATLAIPPGTRLDEQALARHIDEAIDARLRQEGVRPSAQASDAEFLRRAYLDIAGHIPPADKAVAFLDSPEPDKRARLINELLASADYGRHQADIWQALLLPRNSDNRIVRYDAMTRWLEEQFNANKPWDQMVRAIVTASGKTDENPAVYYVLANRGPDKLTDSVTRLFLGVQLQCAQCHNHPFTDWKQDEYWGMAAFFNQVRMQGNPRMAVREGMALSVLDGSQGRPLPRPDSARPVPPKFLQGEQAEIPPGESSRAVLAEWMTGPKNPYFARAMVNRTWAGLFGRGLVNPVDDMHDGNPPSHPQLLADLADQFRASGCDLKALVRGICNSRAYQRSGRAQSGNAKADAELFARMAVKVLTPEQLFDSLVQVLGPPRQPPQQAKRGPKMPPVARLNPPTPRTQFINFFKVEDADPTDYQVGIPQALRLMNGPQLNNPAIINPLLKARTPPDQIIEHLFLRTLSRRPTPKELSRLVAYVGQFRSEPLRAYGDILWTLINCSEFALNH